MLGSDLPDGRIVSNRTAAACWVALSPAQPSRWA